MSTVYFWDKGEVKTVPTAYDIDRTPLRNKFCVDTGELPTNPTMRYGQFLDIGGYPVALEQLPKEFHMHLLLLGVG